jgi:WW domain-binding protein 4
VNCVESFTLRRLQRVSSQFAAFVVESRFLHAFSHVSVRVRAWTVPEVRLLWLCQSALLLHYSLCGEAARCRPARDLKRRAMASEYFSSSRADWCALCKCFVQPHGNAKRAHERSEKHKKNVERKLRDIRTKESSEAKEADKMKKQMAEIELKAAEAYAADLAAAGRLAEAAALKPKPLSAGARLREQEEHAKKELESAIERELHAREEAEYRATQTLGAWKFDDRSKYYWHGKSSCYFDPKTKMYFNNVTKAWSKTAPKGAPPPPSTDSGGAATSNQSGQYALGPYARGKAASVSVSTPAPAQPMATAKQAFAAARNVQSTTMTSAKPSVASQPTLAPKTTTTSMHNLGFGTNHPKFEAARARTQASAARAVSATGGTQFEAKLLGGYVTTSQSGADSSKKRPASSMSKKVDKEEAEALKRREAARARVEARTKKQFGLG